MTAIILDYCGTTRDRALAEGYQERTVLVKRSECMSTVENVQDMEGECRRLNATTFMVGCAWGIEIPEVRNGS